MKWVASLNPILGLGQPMDAYVLEQVVANCLKAPPFTAIAFRQVLQEDNCLVIASEMATYFTAVIDSYYAKSIDSSLCSLRIAWNRFNKPLSMTTSTRELAYLRSNFMSPVLLKEMIIGVGGSELLVREGDQNIIKLHKPNLVCKLSTDFYHMSGEFECPLFLTAAPRLLTEGG
jgi:hypothetical protein